VGSKLGLYLAEAGFQEVQLEVRPITSHEIGLELFLDLTTGFKHEQLAARHASFGAQALADIYEILEVPSAWGAVGVFVATGTRG